MAANLHPVIVGVDGSPASFGAVRWAADEAARLRLPLKIVHAIELHGPFEEILDEHGLAIDAANEIRLRQPGLHVTTATWHGEPARVLVTLSRHASLVVVGSRGSGGFRSLLVGSVGVHLAGHAHCPVLVVHQAERWADHDAPLPHDRPIVVGADGSADGERAVGLAFAEAAARAVPLVAVRTWHEPEHRWGFSADRSTLPAATLRELTSELEPWRAKYPAVQAEPRVVHCPSVPALLDEARDALMVVLGARGRGGFEGLRLGAVTQQVLEHSAVPVLVARQG
jgi:nucleotide-binding universal stress UspA family protein